VTPGPTPERTTEPTERIETAQGGRSVGSVSSVVGASPNSFQAYWRRMEPWHLVPAFRAPGDCNPVHSPSDAKCLASTWSGCGRRGPRLGVVVGLEAEVEE
jgi:hypothetical protein